MKRWIVPLTVVGILGLFLAFVSFRRDWHHYLWTGHMPGFLGRLATKVDVFYIDYHVYPDKLSDLLPTLDLSGKEDLMSILDDKMGNQYQYRIVTNGFIISASRPGGIFFRKEAMTMYFNTDYNFDKVVYNRGVVLPEKGVGVPSPNK